MNPLSEPRVEARGRLNLVLLRVTSMWWRLICRVAYNSHFVRGTGLMLEQRLSLWYYVSSSFIAGLSYTRQLGNFIFSRSAIGAILPSTHLALSHQSDCTMIAIFHCVYSNFVIALHYKVSTRCRTKRECALTKRGNVRNRRYGPRTRIQPIN